MQSKIIKPHTNCIKESSVQEHSNFVGTRQFNTNLFGTQNFILVNRRSFSHAYQSPQNLHLNGICNGMT